MSFLDDMTLSSKELLISLPYRVGLLVSKSDTAGGEEADAKEMQALNNIIHGFAEQVFGSEQIQYIISETLAQKQKWPDWSDDLSAVPEECRQAIDIMKDHMGKKDIDAFINHLIEIGEAVALAFKEYEHEESLSRKIKIYMSYALLKLKKSKSRNAPRSLQEFLSISVSERKALNEIAQALGTTYT